MASDKRKGGVAAKAQSSTTKVPLKQKTLLDSFFSKTQKNMPNRLPPSAEVNGSSTVETPPTTTDPSNSIDLTETSSKSTLPILEIAEEQAEKENDVSSTENDHIDDRRSPSIVILEDMQDSLAITTVNDNKMPRTKSQQDIATEGKTKDKPIVIPSSPIKAAASYSRLNESVHPFFISKAKSIAPSASTANRKPPAKPLIQLPPYPHRFGQHVRGPQTPVEYPPRKFSSRPSKGPDRVTEESRSYAFLKRGTPLEKQSTKTHMPPLFDASSEFLVNDIPMEHKSSHPAIARLINHGPDDTPTSRRPWAEKWRPSCAQEVLGNEQSALYLRDWLRALELQLEPNTAPLVLDLPKGGQSKGKSKEVKRGTKRPRVVRAVEKSRGRKKSRLDSDEEDNWIVHTDEEEEEEVHYEDTDDFDDILIAPGTSSLSTSVQDMPPSIIGKQDQGLGQLHNTILLSGPSGSGKTASVYACAEELGWDVFEVYPGVGRRNGANIDNLIGEVGKNHLVLQNRQSGDVLKSFLQQKSKSKVPDADAPPATSDFLPSYSPRKQTFASNIDKDSTSSTTKPIRQSLILLEEVDILFKEDTNFWTTVTRIIKECKRPVICTCNDISLVPLEDLPLQSILHFVPCPPGAAVSYLQALCSAEGYSVDSKALYRLYADPFTHCHDLSDSSLSLSVVPDLRWTINALQVICPCIHGLGSEDTHLGSFPSVSAHGREGDGSSSLIDASPRISMRRSELLSYLDCNLNQGLFQVLVAADLANHVPSDDDENGHIILHDLHTRDTAQYGRYDRHEDIISTAVHLSRGLFDVDISQDGLEMQANEERRKNIDRKQRLVLQEVCPTAIWSRRDGCLPLDYVPIIRQIVEAEDMQEVLDEEKGPRTGRLTRNSARSNGHVRTVNLTEEGRRALFWQ